MYVVLVFAVIFQLFDTFEILIYEFDANTIDIILTIRTILHLTPNFGLYHVIHNISFCEY